MVTEKLVRTTITLPAELKEKMNRSGENWSEVIREMIRQRIEEEGQTDMAEAIILNEKVKRSAPKNWSSLQVIKQWRRRTST
jgi:metal-responsive CopG/Arc/MetJ family transcriptional regulator